MRQIKFRCWGGEEMRDTFSVQSNGDVLYSGEIMEQWVLMQFTGLKDRNGVEIYEGDVVKGVLYYPQSIFDEPTKLLEETNKVIFDKGCWCIDGNDDYEGGVLCRYDELYVLGNSYESPELLKQII